jgi:hypothetical protein
MKAICSCTVLCFLAAALFWSEATSAETVVLRSGFIGGVPGSPGQTEDDITDIVGTSCATALRSQAFTATDFADARNGAPAVVITPYLPYWIPSLECDPEARWINAASDDGFGTPPYSALYAMPFHVSSSSIVAATFTLCWAVDDRLGDWPNDAPGPNPIGVYLNESPLNDDFSTDGAMFEQRVASMDVTSYLVPGDNTLYIYQRDQGCAVAGLIFNATIAIDGATPAQSETWGRIKVTYK